MKNYKSYAMRAFALLTKTDNPYKKAKALLLMSRFKAKEQEQTS